MYSLLTGQTPYGGDTVMRKLLAQRDHPIPSLRAKRAAVTAELEDVFHRMVAKRPEERYQSMSDVITARFTSCPNWSAELAWISGSALADRAFSKPPSSLLRWPTL